MKPQPIDPNLQMSDIKAYTVWVAFFVLGLLAEADTVFQTKPKGIRRAAKYFRDTYQHNPKKKPQPKLFRGILIDPAIMPYSLRMPSDPERPTTSFTESPSTALWFAWEKSSMNKLLHAKYPEAKGYIASYTPKKHEILFHHKWTRLIKKWITLHNSVYPDDKRVLELDEIVEQYTDPSQIPATQLNWCLKTQSEVIILQHEPILWMPIENLPLNKTLLTDLETVHNLKTND